MYYDFKMLPLVRGAGLRGNLPVNWIQGNPFHGERGEGHLP
jgi:hypothetical protein